MWVQGCQMILRLLTNDILYHILYRHMHMTYEGMFFHPRKTTVNNKLSMIASLSYSISHTGVYQCYHIWKGCPWRHWYNEVSEYIITQNSADIFWRLFVKCKCILISIHNPPKPASFCFCFSPFLHLSVTIWLSDSLSLSLSLSLSSCSLTFW